MRTREAQGVSDRAKRGGRTGQLGRVAEAADLLAGHGLELRGEGSRDGGARGVSGGCKLRERRAPGAEMGGIMVAVNTGPNERTASLWWGFNLSRRTSFLCFVVTFTL